MDRTLVFENDGALELHESLFPESADHRLTWETLVGLLFPDPLSKAERNEIFQSLLGPEERAKAEAWLATLLRLRSASILTAEDTAFAFSELPATPKNETLRQLAQKYIDSPIEPDVFRRTHDLVERLKEGDVAFQGGTHVRFIRGLGPAAPAFLELAAAFSLASGVESAELQELWDAPEGAGERAAGTLSRGARRESAVLTGDAFRCHAALHQRIARWIDRGVPPRDIAVAYHGERGGWHALRLFLASRSIPFRIVGHPPTPDPEPTDGLAPLLVALRRDRSRSVGERLALGHTLARLAPYRKALEPWSESLAGFEKRGLIPEGTTRSLTELSSGAEPPLPPPVPAAPESDTVLLLPFLPLPHDLRPFTAGYADLTLFHSEHPKDLLTESEIERLVLIGLTVPGARAFRERARERLTAFATATGGPKRPLFSAIPPEELPSTRRRLTLRPRAPRSGRFFGAWERSQGLEDADAPRPASGAEKNGVRLSATQLETYARCPAQHFFSHRLRLRDDPAGEEAFRLILGVATHRALEVVGGALRTSGAGVFSPFHADALERAFLIAVEEKAPGLSPESVLGRSLRRAFLGLLPGLFAIEARLSETLGARVLESLELPFRQELGTVTVTGKIDRVDALADGARLVIDYKTGSVDFTPEHLARGESFQALLYFDAVQNSPGKPVAGVLFYDLRSQEAKRGLVLHERVPALKKAMTRGHCLPAERVEAILASGREHLCRIAVAIQGGVFSPQPSAETCGSCVYGGLCRRRYGYG